MKSSSASEKTNPNKPNLHFTAENAEHAEKKNIYVSDCSIKKCALYPISPCFRPSQWLCYGEWTLRTRRLIENKPNQSQYQIGRQMTDDRRWKAGNHDTHPESTKNAKFRLHYHKGLAYNKVNSFSCRVENISMVNICWEGLI